MSDKLKACPFCGGQSDLIECSDASWHVMCAAGKCGGQTPYGRTKQEAIERWNTRAQLPSQGGEAVAPACWQYKVYEERRFYPTDPRKQDFWSALDGIAHSAEPLYTRPADPGAVAVRRFPMQRGPSIPWDFAEALYAGYSAVYGTKQSLERLAERGGFSFKEIEVMYADPRMRAAIDRALLANSEGVKP